VTVNPAMTYKEIPKQWINDNASPNHGDVEALRNLSVLAATQMLLSAARTRKLE